MIYPISRHPRDCARALDNVTLVGNCREATQLLCGALRAIGFSDPKIYQGQARSLIWTSWTGATNSNFNWIAIYAQNCMKEYFQRFGKVHRSAGVCRFAQHHGQILLPKGALLPFPNTTNWQALPATQAYRRALIVKWAYSTPRWTNQDCPNWAHFCIANGGTSLTQATESSNA